MDRRASTRSGTGPTIKPTGGEARKSGRTWWLDGGSYSPGKSPPAAIELRRPSGERYDHGELLPMIERALAPPVEQPKPETRPLLRVTP